MTEVKEDQLLVRQMQKDYYFARKNGCDKTWNEYASFRYHLEAAYERHYGRTPMTWTEFKTRYGIPQGMALNRTNKCLARVKFY